MTNNNKAQLETSIVDTTLSSGVYKNETDLQFKNLPDFNAEKYNIISSSPINTPKNFKSRYNLFEEPKKLSLNNEVKPKINKKFEDYKCDYSEESR